MKLPEETKKRVAELVEAEDRYGLMLLAVSLWVEAYHPKSIRAAVYAVQDEDMEPTRVRIPLSACGEASAPH